MKKKYLLFLLLTFFSMSLSFGKLKPILIQGKIDSSILARFASSNLLVKIHDRAMKLINEEELIEVHIGKDRMFEVSIMPADSTAYLSFWIKNNNPEQKQLKMDELYPIHFPMRLVVGLEEQYLFESGDVIQLSINKEGLRFKGLGAEKLNCQFAIYKIPEISELLSPRLNELRNAKEFQAYYKLLDQCFDQNITLLKNLMQTYDDGIKKSTYNLICADAISMLEFRFLFNTIESANINANKVMIQHFESHLEQDNLLDFDTATLCKSVNFTEMLALKEYRALQFREGQATFNDLFDVITKKYSGVLLGQLILAAVSMSNPETVKNNFERVRKAVIDNRSNQVLNTWYDRQKTAFPFELTDLNGKIHRLGDYKGKVIVMEFWFTFCTACKQLNAAMHPIIDRYKDNEEIVFLSVSTDKLRESWLKSVASGQYTSPHNVNLYTSGLGFAHPLLQFYNFQGAPRQLIIGKTGNLVSTSPPRPDGGDASVRKSNTEKFIAILEQCLK